MLFVPKFLEQPLGDSVLLVGRQRREFRDGGVQCAGHWTYYTHPGRTRANNRLQRRGGRRPPLNRRGRRPSQRRRRRGCPPARGLGREGGGKNGREAPPPAGGA